MAKFFQVARDSVGNALASPIVTLFNVGTTTAAAIYSDAALSVPKANPFTGGADGSYELFVLPGHYKLRVEKAGYATFEVDDVWIGGDRLDVRDFGARGDGTTDDTVAIQAAVTAAHAIGNGATVHFPRGRYKLTSTITINKGIYLRGAGFGDVVASGSGIMGSGADGTTIVWGGGAAGMFRFVAAAAGDQLHGGGITDLLLDGNNTATVLIQISSCRETLVSVATFRPTVGALLLDDTGGRLCDSVYVPRLIARIGPAAAAAGAYGVWVKGDVSAGNGGCTNHWFGDVHVEFDTGDAFIWEDVDTCVVVKYQATARGAGTGKAMYFKNGDGAFSARKILICHYTGGKIVAESATLANRILFVNSESVSIDNGGNTGALCYDAHDRLHGDVYEGQTRYLMMDRLPVPVDAIRVGANAVETTIGVPAWPIISLPNGVTATISFSYPAIHRWNHGQIRGVRIFAFPITAPASGDVGFTLNGISVAAGAGGLNTVEQTVTATKTITTTTNTLTVVELLFSTPLDYNRGEWFSMILSRAGGTDACDADVAIGGIQVLYKSDGPDGSAATWDIPLDQLA